MWFSVDKVRAMWSARHGSQSRGHFASWWIGRHSPVQEGESCLQGHDRNEMKATHVSSAHVLKCLCTLEVAKHPPTHSKNMCTNVHGRWPISQHGWHWGHFISLPQSAARPAGAKGQKPGPANLSLLHQPYPSPWHICRYWCCGFFHLSMLTFLVPYVLLSTRSCTHARKPLKCCRYYQQSYVAI